jgi:hypothetical protein
MKSYVDIAAHLPAFQAMAKQIYLSQMVAGVKNADMAFVVLVECEMTGQTIFEWAEENHVVGTRPTMKYDAMIAAYNQLPNCKFELLEKTPERCKIALTDGGKRTEFSLTWDELKKEAIPYNGKESEIVAALSSGDVSKLNLKDKYATPRSRAVMMYARLVGDSIRSTRPEVTKGRYTPEEVEDFAGDEPKPKATTAVTPSAPSAPSAPVAPIAPSSPAAKPEPKADVAKAETPTAEGNPSPAAESTQQDTQQEPQQDTQQHTLAGKTEVDLNGPSTPEQKSEILALLQQMKRDGLDFISKVKAKLEACGVAGGIAGLTMAEAEKLKSALEYKRIEDWIQNPIRP